MACSGQETPAMSHIASTFRALTCRLNVEPLEDRSLPSALPLPLPPLVKHPDHTPGPPADVAAKAAGKHDGGEDGVHGNSAHHDGDSAGHGRSDAKRKDAENGIGQETAGLPE